MGIMKITWAGPITDEWRMASGRFTDTITTGMACFFSFLFFSLSTTFLIVHGLLTLHDTLQCTIY